MVQRGIATQAHLPRSQPTFGRTHLYCMNIVTHPRDIYFYRSHANGTHYPVHKLLMPLIMPQLPAILDLSLLSNSQL
jgi:hypothetical protein